MSKAGERARVEGKGKDKVNIPALANYGLERGTLERVAHIRQQRADVGHRRA